MPGTKVDGVKTNLVLEAMRVRDLSPLTFLGIEHLSLGEVDTGKLYHGQLRPIENETKTE